MNCFTCLTTALKLENLGVIFENNTSFFFLKDLHLLSCLTSAYILISPLFTQADSFSELVPFCFSFYFHLFVMGLLCMPHVSNCADEERVFNLLEL